MIYLRNTRPDLQDIADKWANDLQKFLMEELKYPNYVIIPRGRITFKKRYRKYIFLLYDTMKKRGMCKSQMKFVHKIIFHFMKDFHNNIADCQKINYYSRFQNTLRRIFPWTLDVITPVFVQLYEDFSKNKAYTYFEKLNVRTCPYCNRQYTFTISKDKTKNFKTRPEYDHFYDKKDYPLLALSFYNLVPSCHICNHSKRTRSVKVNPYLKGFKTKFSIQVGNNEKYTNINDIKSIKTINDFHISFANPSHDEEQNIAIFGLKHLYSEHKDYVLELVEKSEAYNQLMCKNIAEEFQGIFTTQQQVYDLVWGKYLQDVELEKRPLSKLTKDILEQIGIQ